MASENNIVQSVKFFESGSTSFVLAVVFNTKWKKHSLYLTRNYSYTEDGATKQGSNTIFLSLTYPAALIGQLEPAYRFAKQLEELGVEIYRIFTLFFLNSLFIST